MGRKVALPAAPLCTRSTTPSYSLLTTQRACIWLTVPRIGMPFSISLVDYKERRMTCIAVVEIFTSALGARAPGLAPVFFAGSTRPLGSIFLPLEQLGQAAHLQPQPASISQSWLLPPHCSSLSHCRRLNTPWIQNTCFPTAFARREGPVMTKIIGPPSAGCNLELRND